MPLKNKKRKSLEPLTPKDIRIRLLDREKSIVELAEDFSARLGKTVWPSDISAVIRRRPGNVFPEIRELLAEFLGVEVSQVGRESVREMETAAA